MTTIGIIGAGPAGVTAALEAQKHGAHVLLFDSNPSVGKKLLVTGSGRCNLTNAQAKPNSYNTQQLNVVESVFAQLDHLGLLHYLDELGILTYSTDDGWYYPVSNSAANVVEILASHLSKAKIDLRLEHKVSRIISQKRGFLLQFHTGQPTVFVDKLIIAAGGKAYPALGSDGSIFSILETMGHEILPVYPALAPIIVPSKQIKPFFGARTDAQLRLYENDKLLGETVGNIIFTKTGINGPGVMDLSHLVSQYGTGKITLTINFLAKYQQQFEELLSRFAQTSISIRALVGSVVPNKIGNHFLDLLHFPADTVMDQLKESDRHKITKSLSSYRVDVEGVRGFDFCQASTGGISLKDVHETTLESKNLPGLYFAGETLDVNGPCGGYNLQWAFSSGFVAGKHAATTNGG